MKSPCIRDFAPLILLSSCLYLPSLGGQQASKLVPPQKATLCDDQGCLEMTWAGDHYDAHRPGINAVQVQFWVKKWTRDDVELYGKTTFAINNGNPAEGAYHGRISPDGVSLAGANVDWDVGPTQKGNKPFTMKWGKGAAPAGTSNVSSAPPDRPNFQEIKNQTLKNPFSNLQPDKTYRPPVAPAWQPDTKPTPGPDLSGIWEFDRNGNALKLLIIQLRGRLWGANAGNLPFTMPGEEVMSSEYPINGSGDIVIRSGQGTEVGWTPGKITVQDANNIIFAKAPFHRVAGHPLKDMPCNPATAASIDAEEAYGRGQIYYKLGDIPGADCWFYVAAAKGDAQAQASYGLALRLGRGIASDKEQAFHWFQLSAMQNNYFGIYNLVGMMLEGYAGPVSMERTTYWEKRAKANNPDILQGAMHMVSPSIQWTQEVSPPCGVGQLQSATGDQALAHGIVAFQAMVFSRAACWFNISARQGNLHANVYQGILSIYGWGMPANQKAGFDYMKKAADGGDWFGVSYLAEFYRRGIGTPADFGQGRQLWDKATSNNPGGYSGGWAAYAIVSGTMLNDTQARELRNGLLSAAFNTQCTPDEIQRARTQYGAHYDWHLTCDPSPDTKAREDAESDALTPDLFFHNTVDYPQEISPEYVAPGNPLAF